MKKILLLILFFICLAGCSKEPEPSELILGGWTNQSNDTYIYLKVKLEGKWDASVKIANSQSKIIQVKGEASGRWHIEDNTLVLTVFDSDVSNVFQKNVTNFYEIVKIDGNEMKLMDAHSRVIVWNAVKNEDAEGGGMVESVRMAPFTVNLNKTRSRDKDRYLCLNLKIILKEILPGNELQRIHPKAREAVLMYLSSLVYKDVKNLDQIQEMQETLKIILNPYIGDMVEKVEIDHVIVSSTIDRVEEFLIEHSLKTRMSQKESGESAGKGEESEKGKETE